MLTILLILKVSNQTIQTSQVEVTDKRPTAIFGKVIIYAMSNTHSIKNWLHG